MNFLDTFQEMSKSHLHHGGNYSETIGVWTITASELGEWNNSRYSKSWHRSHGGVWETHGRSVTFERAWGRGKRKLEVMVGSWRGNWLQKSLIKAGIVKPVKSKVPLYVRLTKYHDAKKIAVKRGYTFYERSFAGEFIDYVVVSPLGMTYHDEKRGNLIRGLKRKMRKRAGKVEEIDFQFLHKNLGFCEPGIKDFAEKTGLSTDARYSPRQIHDAIKRVGYQKVEIYAPEISALANACGYKFTL